METRVDYEALRAIADPLPIGVILAGRAGDVLFHNARGAELLGVDSFDLLEKGVSGFPQRIGLGADWESLRTGGRSREQFIASDHERKLSITFSRGEASGFGDACVLILIADVSEQSRLKEFRDGFQSEILHRLMGPLTSIHTTLAFLRSDLCGPLPDAVKEVVALGHAEAHRLHRLVNDLGHLLSLEGPAPEGDLYRENVDLAASVRRALRKAGRLAPGREGIFELKALEITPIVVADYDKVGFILAHMLSHAVGQTASGTPVRVSVSGGAEGMGEVRVAYAGAGIGEEELRMAFAKFHRPAGAGETTDGDSGLGLHVSQGFARLMGGSLELHAPAAQEVTLVLRLPPASGWAGFEREAGR